MVWAGKGKTAVVGIGMSKLVRHSEKSLGMLALEACKAAIEDAGLKPSDIDGIVTYPDQPFRGAGSRDGEDLVTAQFMMNNGFLGPDIKWYAQISTGMIASAPIEGINALISGACNYVLFWRAMHMPKGTYNTYRMNTAAGDAQFSATYGLANPYQIHALQYRNYLNKFGYDREMMATLVMNSRRNATLNPNAYFYGQPMTREDYLNARMIADPLCLFDCDIPVEGCTALVLTRADLAQALKNKPAYISGFGQNTAKQLEYVAYMVADYMKAGVPHANKIWETAGMGPKDIQAAQLYDGFASSTLYWLEAAGFCKEGEALAFVQDGRVALEGELPLNTFGGSLSEGRLHGMGHLAEAVRQVTDRAGERQIAGCENSIAIDGSPLLRGSGMIFSRHADN
jgi:acetyl-CoA acetyltransferase